ncbi:hypothetical protein KQX54_004135 [Cotesia glomerata]|uniref:Uncharacterized protein n=1 Tax=Cotesia glomerata TaxID=32391 RepID=A0AAV7IM33_COTGL|nr:hypothetical protein KQX54_004135 [Cotesia glomerata]
MKNGADVNARFPEDERHSTVIHYMIKYGFELGVTRLLFQSDLNPAEIDFETVQLAKIIDSEFLVSDLVYYLRTNSKIQSIVVNLVHWTVTRNAMGWPVDKKILECPIRNCIPKDDYMKTINRITKNVTMEVQFMKKKKFDSGSDTIWHFLTCNRNELVREN